MVEEFKCRDPGCQRKYKSEKCRVRHEQKCYSLFADDNNTTTSDKDQKTTPESEDHIFNYRCLHLSLGLLLCDAEDSVKEGDGDRLSRVWKFLTFIYQFGGGNKYALSGLQASLLGLLTPKDAHKFKWNRFPGLKEGPGTRIPRDLRLEQHNKVCKGQVRAMGLKNTTNVCRRRYKI